MKQLTNDSQLSNASDLADRIASRAFVSSLVLWEDSSDVEYVVSILGGELEIFRRLDWLVVVEPLNQWFWCSNDVASELNWLPLVHLVVSDWFQQLWSDE